MNKERSIESYFNGVLKNIDIILNSDFYKKSDVKNLNKVKLKMKKWYKNYKVKNTLTGINPKELEYMDLEITDFFDKYMIIETVLENYSERLLYDFSKLEHEWKEACKYL